MPTKTCRNCKITIPEDALICPYYPTHYDKNEIDRNKNAKYMTFALIGYIGGIINIFDGRFLPGFVLFLISALFLVYFWKRGSKFYKNNKY